MKFHFAPPERKPRSLNGLMVYRTVCGQPGIPGEDAHITRSVHHPSWRQEGYRCKICWAEVEKRLPETRQERPTRPESPVQAPEHHPGRESPLEARRRPQSAYSVKGGSP